MELSATISVQPVLAAVAAASPVLDATKRIISRLRGTPDIDPDT